LPLILIVDDMIDLRRLLGKFLSRAGHVPLMAESGPEALAIIRERKPDLVLLDIGMPDMDGFDVLAAMPRGAGSDLEPPVIMLTAFSDGARLHRARQLGASDYFVKGSFDPSELLERIEQLVA
jgi:DNA-binding response OmpR family regulator